MSDTITLVAGILLTSVGLLALLPFVLRLGRKGVTPENPLQAALMPALAAADAFMHPEEHLYAASAAGESVNEDVEELMAHLFSLRMTVSEVTADVQSVQDALGSEPAEATEPSGEDNTDSDEAEQLRTAEHAA